MKNDIRIEAEEARRLKSDTAFKHFLDLVRENQIQAFKSSAADDIDGREEAHAMMRAVDLIEVQLDASIAAEVLLKRKKIRG